MAYSINGTTLFLQPTTGRWLERPIKGFDGSGHPIYVSTREFEMRWQLISMTDVEQIQGFFNIVAATGTAVVGLPEYNVAPYAFFSYSGCTLEEPMVGEFFEKHQTEVTLLIHNIRT